MSKKENLTFKCQKKNYDDIVLSMKNFAIHLKLQ